MTASETDRVKILDRLGFPPLTGNERFVAMNFVDSFGNGLVLAFTIVYFTRVTSLGLGAVGAAMSVGQLLAIPASLAVGPAIDRFGAKATATAANVVSCSAFLSAPLVSEKWQLALFQFIVQASANGFWTANNSLVALVSGDSGRVRWFALVRALRNIGIGLGGAVSGFALTSSDRWALDGVMAANGFSFLFAALLLASWRPSSLAPRRPAEGRGAGSWRSYRSVFSDRSYWLLVAANLSFVLAATVLSVLLAVFVVDHARLGGWMVGAAVALNTVIVFLLQMPVARAIERRDKSQAVSAASILNIVAFLGFLAMPEFCGTVFAAIVLAAAIVVYSLAEVISGPSMSELSVSLADEENEGRYQALFQMSWSVGMAAAPALLTAFLAADDAYPWIFLIAVSVIAIVLTNIVKRERPQAFLPNVGEKAE